MPNVKFIRSAYSYLSYIRQNAAIVMTVLQISAVTLTVSNMTRSCLFYSKLPGLTLCYGGSNEKFSSFEIKDHGYKSYINLELSAEIYKHLSTNYFRIIFHTTDIDRLYSVLRNDVDLSRIIVFENEPSNATWGERYFHLRDPDGYQISFATPRNDAD
jgi:catechol 2,3-dioxygenase-like lactoylglutathione lyase family enzyme